MNFTDKTYRAKAMCVDLVDNRTGYIETPCGIVRFVHGHSGTWLEMCADGREFVRSFERRVDSDVTLKRLAKKLSADVLIQSEAVWRASLESARAAHVARYQEVAAERDVAEQLADQKSGEVGSLFRRVGELEAAAGEARADCQAVLALLMEFRQSMLGVGFQALPEEAESLRLAAKYLRPTA